MVEFQVMRSGLKFLRLILEVLLWTVLSEVARILGPLFFPPPNRCFFDVEQHPFVRGFVALTIDDAFVRQTVSHSLIAEVGELCKHYSAKVTFFLTLCYSVGDWREREIAQLVVDGHELANHCEEDREYHKDSQQNFERALQETDSFIRANSNGSGAKWFRAPCARLSQSMARVLQRKGLTHVMLDSYANDPHIPYPKFLAWVMCRRVTHGSIMTLHMPERGFREWNLTTLELVLSKLNSQGLRTITLSELAMRASMSSHCFLGSQMPPDLLPALNLLWNKVWPSSHPLFVGEETSANKETNKACYLWNRKQWEDDIFFLVLYREKDFQEDNKDWIVGARILAHARLRPRLLKFRGKEHKVAGLADVVCDSSVRRQGLAKHVVEASRKYAQEAFLDVVGFCSNSNSSFYRKCGFEIESRGLLSRWVSSQPDQDENDDEDVLSFNVTKSLLSEVACHTDDQVEIPGKLW
eukprot:Lithocolla_globosa_v1_NODE_942_length_3055_cov_21.691000.p1 type:complete len:468 gc:universal NODE_942_length_3055_cov_21.691000:1438-35(-)